MLNLMPQYNSTPQYEHGLPESLGVLLVNLGTPDEPTPEAVRRYLNEFLSDPRVVELPRLIWLPVLHGYILRTRPAKSAAAYRKIWAEQGSPLLLHTLDIARESKSDAWGVGFGFPSLNSAACHQPCALHQTGSGTPHRGEREEAPPASGRPSR